MRSRCFDETQDLTAEVIFPPMYGAHLKDQPQFRKDSPNYKGPDQRHLFADSV